MAIRLYLITEGTPNAEQQEVLNKHVPQATEHAEHFNLFGFGRITRQVYDTAESFGFDGELGSTSDPQQVRELLDAQGVPGASELAQAGFGVTWN